MGHPHATGQEDSGPSVADLCGFTPPVLESKHPFLAMGKDSESSNIIKENLDAGKLLREAADVPSLELFKAMLDGALRNLI